jgi:hypothetical protein
VRTGSAQAGPFVYWEEAVLDFDLIAGTYANLLHQFVQEVLLLRVRGGCEHLLEIVQWVLRSDPSRVSTIAHVHPEKTFPTISPEISA